MENLPYAFIRLWSRFHGTLVGHLAVCPHSAAFALCDDDTTQDCTDLIADGRLIYDAIVASSAGPLPMALEEDQNELRLLYEEAAPTARFGEVARVGTIQIAASRFAASRLLDRFVAWRADELVPSWGQVTAAIGAVASRVGASRGITVWNAEGRRGDNDLPTFVVQTRGATDALTLTLHPAERRVRCFAELGTGGWWDCGYRVENGGTWVGPLAPAAQSRPITGIEAIAGDIVDGWLVAVVPHH
jgi:hypothetical protein